MFFYATNKSLLNLSSPKILNHLNLINMKKTLLLLLVSFFVVSINLPAQTISNSLSATLKKQNLMLGTDKFNKFPVTMNIGNEQTVSAPAMKRNTSAPFATRNKSISDTRASVAVGQSVYDLQSNNSMARRIISHPDGTISMVWTFSTDGGASYTNRGTAWNYYDGTNLLLPTATLSRLENVRTGFTNIGLMGNNQEVIMAHLSSPFDFTVGKNTTKGSNSWSFNNANASVNLGSLNEASLWGRIAIADPNNNSIHLISNYGDTSIYVDGIQNPFVYSRSTDGGATWNPKAILLPGYDTTRTLNGIAETYAIDALGDVVAIVHGGLGDDVTLWKSTDNGNTWTRTLIDSFPYAPDYSVSADPDNDSIPTNDGTLSVVLDSNGMAHVAYAYSEVGRSSAFVSTTNPQGSIFKPGSIGLIYWDELTLTQVSVPILLVDVDNIINGGDGSGTYDVGQLNTDFNAARYGNNSFLNKPSIAIDENNSNNIFIVFSLPIDGDSTQDGQSFRGVWVVASQDGGQTWGPVQNLTCTPQEENAFPSLAKRVNNNLHILYQWDQEPGTALTNGDPDGSNDFLYGRVTVADVLAGTASCNMQGFEPVGISEQPKPFLSIRNYPNPANGLTNFELLIMKPGDVTLEIQSTLGQKVYSREYNNMNKGKRTLTFDCSSLNPGMYFYNIKSSGHSVSGKFMVE